MTSTTPALRRLIDMPGVRDLEYRALLKREFAEAEARAEFPEIDACVKALFGLTADEAEAKRFRKR
jgi:cytochrome P450